MPLIDGEDVPASERADLDAHLSHCSRCRHDLALAMMMVDTLRTRFPHEDVPLHVQQKIRETLQQEFRRKLESFLYERRMERERERSLRDIKEHAWAETDEIAKLLSDTHLN